MVKVLLTVLQVSTIGSDSFLQPNCRLGNLPSLHANLFENLSLKAFYYDNFLLTLHHPEEAITKDRLMTEMRKVLLNGKPYLDHPIPRSYQLVAEL